MAGTNIACPKCGTEFELTETLAGPAIAEMRRQVEAEAKEREKSIKSREEDLSKLEVSLSKERAAIEAEVEKKLAEQRKAIKEAAVTEAKADVSVQVEDLKQQLDGEKAKRKEAEEAELKIRNEAKKLQEEKEGWELEKQRTLAAERENIRADAKKAADEEYGLRIKEKEKTIADMEAKLKEAQKKATQGSQQTQGEVLELDFEEQLRHLFPWDEIEEVKKGQRGADVVQRVCSAPGVVAGIMLWEAKRAENWSSEWVKKAKQDGRDARADLVIIVTTSMPKGLELFGEVDGAWVCEPKTALLLANVLRARIIEVASVKRSGEGAQGKAERLYEYMTSIQFRSWLEGIAEPFAQMQNDLTSEKRTTFARWKKREKNIERALESIAGLSGDLLALAGDDMKSLPGFGETADKDDEEDI